MTVDPLVIEWITLLIDLYKNKMSSVFPADYSSTPEIENSIADDLFHHIIKQAHDKKWLIIFFPRIFCTVFLVWMSYSFDFLYLLICVYDKNDIYFYDRYYWRETRFNWLNYFVLREVLIEFVLGPDCYQKIIRQLHF